MSKMGGRRAPRTPNFSQEETDLLISLIMKRRRIFLKASSDGETWLKKQAAWKRLTAEFNAIHTSLPRSTKVLKERYEGVKRTLRKKSRNEPLDKFRQIEKAITNSQSIAQLALALGLNIEGLPPVSLDKGEDEMSTESDCSDFSGKSSVVVETISLPLEHADEFEEVDSKFNVFLIPESEEAQPPRTTKPSEVSNGLRDNREPPEPRRGKIHQQTLIPESEEAQPPRTSQDTTPANRKPSEVSNGLRDNREPPEPRRGKIHQQTLYPKSDIVKQRLLTMKRKLEMAEERHEVKLQRMKNRTDYEKRKQELKLKILEVKLHKESEYP